MIAGVKLNHRAACHAGATSFYRGNYDWRTWL